jgi:hypothetical protein
MTIRDGGAPPAVEAEFGSIEISHDYVAQLLRVVEETATDVGEDLRRTVGARGRHREALQLVAYKLEQLRFHLSASRRRLRDLRALRHILEGDGTAMPIRA